MKLKITLKTLVTLAIIVSSVTLTKSQSFTENFDDITTLPGSGWYTQNNSTTVGTINWFQGTSVAGGGPFDAFNGAGNAYLAVNYNSTTGTNTISNWMVAPNETYRNGDVIQFYTQTDPADLFPDRLQVRMSTNGISTNVGAAGNAAAVGDFTTLLLDINPTLVTGVYPTTWTQYTITISGLSAPTSGRIAFRYFVTNGGPTGANSDYIGIDNFVYTAYVCPTLSVSPATISNAVAGVAFSQSLSQTGALGTPTYSITAGALPVGLTLSSGGVLSGTPTATGLYAFNVTVSDASGCSGSQDYLMNVVCPANSAVLSPIAPVCSNASPITLTGGSPAGGVYSGTGVSAGMFNPTAGSQTITYTYTDIYSCVNTATASITVNTAPTVTASATSNLVCAGDMVTLTGGGNAVNYVWNNSVTDGVPFAATATATYQVTGTDGNNCSNTATTTVTVNQLPLVTANASANPLCAGDAVTLSGGGNAVNYVWDNSVTDGVSFIPASTVTYNVTGTDANSCVNTASITVVVNPLPIVTANAATNPICYGDMETLSGGGASSYTWDNSVIDGVAFPALSTITYNVTGTDGNSCMNTSSIIVTVNQLPVVTANASSNIICEGNSETLSGGGAVSYVWDNSVSDGVSFTPAVGSVTYNVIGTDANSCSNSASVMVTVNPVYNVNQFPSICSGFTVTVGANTYDSTGVYTDVLQSVSGCDSTVVTNLTVAAFIGSTNTVTICAGDSVVVGTNTYNSTGTYMAVFTAAGGCDSTITTNLTVTPLPAVTVNSPAICNGSTATLTANGGTTYTWSAGATSTGNNTATASPTSTQSYTVTGTTSSCSGTAVATVTVNPIPTVTLNQFIPSTVCAQSGAFPLPAGTPTGGTYTGTGVTGTTYTPSVPNVGTNQVTYSFTASGCTGTSSQNITVINCLGVEEYSFANNVTIYPNPTSGTFTISISNAKFNELIISILDIQGREVYTATDKNITLDYTKQVSLEGMSKGIYFIKLSNGTDVKVSKLIVE